MSNNLHYKVEFCSESNPKHETFAAFRDENDAEAFFGYVKDHYTGVPSVKLKDCRPLLGKDRGKVLKHFTR